MRMRIPSILCVTCNYHINWCMKHYCYMVCHWSIKLMSQGFSRHDVSKVIFHSWYEEICAKNLRKTWRDSDYTVMFVMILVPRLMFVVELRVLLSSNAGHFCPPFVDIFSSFWICWEWDKNCPWCALIKLYLTSCKLAFSGQPWSCKYELVDAIRFCLDGRKTWGVILKMSLP